MFLKAYDKDGCTPLTFRKELKFCENIDPLKYFVVHTISNLKKVGLIFLELQLKLIFSN